MLVLSRKEMESCVIQLEDGRELKVTVCQIGADRIRLGFDAPPEIKIHRSEVSESIKREAAAQ